MEPTTAPTTRRTGLHTTDHPGDRPSRRAVLCGVLVALAVPGGLAACGSTTTPSETAQPGTTQSGNDALVALADVPDGGGVVVQANGKPLVVTRSGNEVRAFDAVCPHAGTTVAPPVDGVINCPAHGSRFRASDGEKLAGPTPTGLKPVDVAVRGDRVVLAR
ncbi:Rieske (2Fe-2S) protein [Saccharothrix obliqua]|uniref:Rieske (2Fe-2S) protein n=1 Tax=Saccharothrix obliqua TaxID=2861747 RepID=UPI0027E29063|nr:Rieske (2Fe-2S) protein [Saccharothrix obliqua]